VHNLFSFFCSFFFVTGFQYRVYAQIDYADIAQYSSLSENSKENSAKKLNNFAETEAKQKHRKYFELMEKKKRLQNHYMSQSENGYINKAFLEAKNKKEEEIQKLDDYRYMHHSQHGYFPQSINYNHNLMERENGKFGYLQRPSGSDFHTKKHILVFGGNGYLGRHLINHLLDASTFSDAHNIILLHSESSIDDVTESYKHLSSAFYDDISNLRQNNQTDRQTDSNVIYRVYCSRSDSIQECESLREYFNDLIEEQKSIHALLDLSGYQSSFVSDLASYVNAYSLVERYIYLSSEAVYEVCPKRHTHPIKEHNDLRSFRPSVDEKLSRDYAYGNEKKKAEEILHRFQKKSEKNIASRDYNTATMNYISVRIPDVIGPREPTHRYLIYHLLVKAQLYALKHQNTMADIFMLPIPLESDNLYDAEEIDDAMTSLNSEQKMNVDNLPVDTDNFLIESYNEEWNEREISLDVEESEQVNENMEKDSIFENVDMRKTYQPKEFSYISLEDLSKTIDALIQLPIDVAFDTEDLRAYYLQQDSNAMDVLSEKETLKLEHARIHNNAYIPPPSILGKSIAANNLGLWNSAINIAHPVPVTNIKLIQSIATILSSDQALNEDQPANFISREENQFEESTVLHYVYQNKHGLLPSRPRLGPLDVGKAKLYLDIKVNKEDDEANASTITLQSLKETVEQSSKYYEDILHNQKQNEEIRSSLKLFYEFYDYDFYVQFEEDKNANDLENSESNGRLKYKTKEEMWSIFMETLYAIYRNPVFLEELVIEENENDFLLSSIMQLEDRG